MGVETEQRSSDRSSRSASSAGNQSAHDRVPTEAELTTLFDEAMKRSPSQSTTKAMSKDEQEKFLEAMGDPEFRSLLNDYMKEISDPANRAETETYLAQLEREQKVPQDKMLIKPSPGFVVKTKWNGSEKLFVNICSSEKLQPPSSTKVETGPRPGTSWSLPYSVGPERMEPDKSGGLVTTYDVCFHPRTLQFATTQRPYRDMVVHTCLDAIEPLLRKSQGKHDGVLARDYHVLKGVLYKSGEPVTMCLSTPKSEIPPNKQKEKKVEQLNPSVASEEKAKTIAHEVAPANKPLIEEVTSSRPPETTEQTSKPLPTLDYRIVYRGKFEMMDHMQGTYDNRNQPAQLPNRPKELVVEISFPTHSSAKGIDLDVNDRVVKVNTAGYALLEIKLPFAVLEEKGGARFDKKARKLIVTLPVQPPEPVPVKRMAIVEQEDGEDDEVEEEVETAKVIAPPPVKKPTTGGTSAAQKTPPVKDDTFAPLRETALMVANDPLYLPRDPSPNLPRDPAKQDTRKILPSPNPANGESTLEQKVKQHVAQDASYDDLPPLESCSEDEDDIELDLEDMVALDPPAYVSSPDVESVAKPSSPTTSGVRILHLTPPFTTKETASCISYIFDVAAVDRASVKLEFPSPTSICIAFATEQACYKLDVEDFKAEIDKDRSEIEVASENAVVILYKAEARSTASKEADKPVLTPAPPPVVRFQNNLLYDID